MNILIGLDDSEFSEEAVRTVIAHIRTQDTRIRVLHVLQQPNWAGAPPQMAPGYAPEMEDERKQARALVARAARQLGDAGFNVDTAVEEGDVRETIIDTAAAWPADLVVIGSHGRKGIERFLLGSVAEFVAHHVKCSVTIVRRPRTE